MKLAYDFKGKLKTFPSFVIPRKCHGLSSRKNSLLGITNVIACLKPF